MKLGCFAWLVLCLGCINDGDEAAFGQPVDAGVDAVLAVCGDDVLAAGEDCDDGNVTAGDGCSPACRVECGDGSLDTDDSDGYREACDDGGSEDDDGCSAACVVESCGDGILHTFNGERCDDGNAADGDACDTASDQCALPSGAIGEVAAGETLSQTVTIDAGGATDCSIAAIHVAVGLAKASDVGDLLLTLTHESSSQTATLLAGSTNADGVSGTYTFADIGNALAFPTATSGSDVGEGVYRADEIDSLLQVFSPGGAPIDPTGDWTITADNSASASPVTIGTVGVFVTADCARTFTSRSSSIDLAAPAGETMNVANECVAPIAGSSATLSVFAPDAGTLELSLALAGTEVVLLEPDGNTDTVTADALVFEDGGPDFPTSSGGFPRDEVPGGVYAPDGPGSFGDFNGADPDDTWTLSFGSEAAAGVDRLFQWSVSLSCPTQDFMSVGENRTQLCQGFHQICGGHAQVTIVEELYLAPACEQQCEDEVQAEYDVCVADFVDMGLDPTVAAILCENILTNGIPLCRNRVSPLYDACLVEKHAECGCPLDCGTPCSDLRDCLATTPPPFHQDCRDQFEVSGCTTCCGNSTCDANTGADPFAEDLDCAQCNNECSAAECS